MSSDAGRTIPGGTQGNFINVVFSFSLSNTNKSFTVDQNGNVHCQNLTATQAVNCTILNATTAAFTNLLASGLLTFGSFTNAAGNIFTTNSTAAPYTDILASPGFQATTTPALNTFAFSMKNGPFIVDFNGKVTGFSFFTSTNSMTCSNAGLLRAWQFGTSGVGSGTLNAFTVDPFGNLKATTFINGGSTFGVDSSGNLTANTVSVWTGSSYTNVQTEINTLNSQVATLNANVATLQGNVTALQSQVAALQTTPQTPIAWVVLSYSTAANTLTQVAASSNVTWYWGVTLGGAPGTGQVGFVYTGPQTPQYFAQVNLMVDASAGAAPMTTMTQANATPVSLFGQNVNWLVYTWNLAGTPANASFAIFLY